MNNRNIVVALRTQHDNLGDWLIIKSLIDQIAKSNPVLLDIYGVPETFYQPLLAENVSVLQQQAPVENCRSLAFVRWVLSVNKPVGLLMSPGHFGDIYPIKSQFRWALQCMGATLYALAGVRCYRFGASFERLGPIALLATKIYAIPHTLVLRGTRLKLPFKSSCDMIVLRNPTDRSAVVSRSVPLKKILVSFRNDRGDSRYQSENLEYWAKLAMAVGERTNLPIQVCFQVGRDLDPAEELVSELRKSGIDTGPPIEIGRENLDQQYSEDTVVLSNRLHVALTALVNGACAIAVLSKCHDSKVFEAFEGAGVTEQCVGVDNESEIKVTSLIHGWTSEKRAEIHTSLVKKRNELISIIQTELEK